jgi:hypothetical protein
MTPADLLAELSARHVVLIPDGHSLRYRAPHGALTPQLRAEAKRLKPGLLRMVAEAPRPYLGPCGELVVPLGCPALFAWWLAPDLEERRRRFEAARSSALAGATPGGSA